jgi:hypothetical protein
VLAHQEKKAARVGVLNAVAVERDLRQASQRSEERFVRDPGDDPKSRLWVAAAGRTQG